MKHWSQDIHAPKAAPERCVRIAFDFFVNGVSIMIADSPAIGSKTKSCTLSLEGAKRFRQVLGAEINKAEQESGLPETFWSDSPTWHAVWSDPPKAAGSYVVVREAPEGYVQAVEVWSPEDACFSGGEVLYWADCAPLPQHLLEGNDD